MYLFSFKHAELQICISHFHSSSCAEDGSRNCSVSWLQYIITHFSSVTCRPRVAVHASVCTSEAFHLFCTFLHRLSHVLSVLMEKGKLLQSPLVLVFAAQPSPVNPLPVTSVVWSMWRERLFQLSIPVRLIGELVGTPVVISCTYLCFHWCMSWAECVSYSYFSSCASDGSRNCSVSLNLSPVASFPTPCTCGCRF